MYQRVRFSRCSRYLFPEKKVWFQRIISGTIQFKDAVWRGMVIFIKKFIQNLKNNVITMIVTARINQEKK